LTNHLPNDNQAGFFLFEVALELISLGEFVWNFIFHLFNSLSDLL
jgi:hypothetical protein